MKYIWTIGGILLLIITAAMIFWNNNTTEKAKNEATVKTENAYFAGGCFWCLEGIFEAQGGVVEARLWYMWGNAEDANYHSVASGQTDHREAVRVIYDPSQIDYTRLVELFWTQIDPTDPGGQFADRWFQYTTAIYYNNKQEQKSAEKSKQTLDDSNKFEQPIATKILPATEFFEAEAYHQDYYKKSALRYKIYSKASGREWFIEENWTQRIGELNEQTYWDSALRKRLTPLQYHVTQEDGTERAFDNEYWDNKDAWIYVDIIDGTPLYSSIDKYDSGTGWPSFSKAIEPSHVSEHEDTKLFMTRIEARSASSDAHLGHIFPDGPKEDGGMRHCINSASLRFIPVEDLSEEGYEEYLELFE